eukprot:SAG11_NODE_19050_length_475_cov_0.968085_1_plen_30_part_10
MPRYSCTAVPTGWAEIVDLPLFTVDLNHNS